MLPFDTRTKIETFLTTTESGSPLKFELSDSNYVRRKVRAAMAMVLSQPEYVVQT